MITLFMILENEQNEKAFSHISNVAWQTSFALQCGKVVFLPRMSTSCKPTLTHQVHFQNPRFHSDTHFELLWARRRLLSSSLENGRKQLFHYSRTLFSLIDSYGDVTRKHFSFAQRRGIITTCVRLLKHTNYVVKAEWQSCATCRAISYSAMITCHLALTDRHQTTVAYCGSTGVAWGGDSEGSRHSFPEFT